MCVRVSRVTVRVSGNYGAAFVVAAFFLFFFVRGYDYLHIIYRKRDFIRVVRRFRKKANRRIASQ